MFKMKIVEGRLSKRRTPENRPRKMKVSKRKRLRLPKNSVPKSFPVMVTCRQYRNWASLPTELLALILENLVLLPDYIRFGAICKGWRSAARDNHQDRSRTCYPQPPMLLLPPPGMGENHMHLYNIWEHKIYFRALAIPYALPYSRRCCGLSYGWFAVFYMNDCSITLFNPFYGNTIRLPNVRFTLELTCRISRITLSCDPRLNPNDWVVVAIYNADSRLAVIRAGHDSWYNVRYPTKDMIAACFYKGQLYVMNRNRELVRIAIQDEANFGLVKMVEQLTKIKVVTLRHKFYFLELLGDLLLVCRSYGVGSVGINMERTVGFCVYKLHLIKDQPTSVDFDDDDDDELAEWIEMKDLGEFCLFLGENKPICISTSIFSYCQPNCIYYTADARQLNSYTLHNPDDIGVFDLTTGHISRFCGILPPQVQMSSAIWISPDLR